jgi:hypothetical protein
MHPMELLANMGHLEARFGLFGDGVSVSEKIGARFAPNVP